MDFGEALRSQWLTINHGEPRPFDNAVFIGPTAVDFSSVGGGIPQTQLQHEAKLIREWRRYDWDRFGQ
jgi:hypothetical protein